MSSPKAATKARRPATNSKPKAAAKFAPAKPKLMPQNELSDQAIRLAREAHIRVIVNSGAEAWMIAPKLAAAHVKGQF